MMKRLIIILSVIVVLGMFFPYFRTLAQPIQTPHENPATAKVSVDSAALLLAYSEVFRIIAARQYQDAQSLFNELGRADVPAELRYLIDRYNALVQQLLTNLNNAEILLNEASTLFSRNLVAEAKKKLDDAEITIRDSQFLLKDIEIATDSLSEQLGVFAAPAASLLKQAYDRIRESLLRLQWLIDQLNQLRKNLIENPPMAIVTSFYYPTLLELSAPDTAYPGLPITISGKISSPDGDVARTIRVLFDDTQVAAATIPARFSLEVITPRQTSVGKHSLTVVVAPQERYSGASKTLTINVSKLPIQANIQMPQLVITPGTIQVSGKVYHGSNPIREARLILYCIQDDSDI